MTETQFKLLDGKQLLETTFDEASRPSLRWLRMQTKARAIPSVRIGRLIFYSPEQVRNALEKRTVRAAQSAQRAEVAA